MSNFRSGNFSHGNTVGTNRATYVLVRNMRGDVTAVATLDGRILESYRYTTYGELVSASSCTPVPSSIPCVLGVCIVVPVCTPHSPVPGLHPFSRLGNTALWAGVHRDPHAGWDWMGARVYLPALRQFLSRDPAGYAVSTDEWAYAPGDPWNFVDPTGWSPERRGNANQDSFVPEGIRAIAELQESARNWRRDTAVWIQDGIANPDVGQALIGLGDGISASYHAVQGMTPGGMISRVVWGDRPHPTQRIRQWMGTDDQVEYAGPSYFAGQVGAFVVETIATGGAGGALDDVARAAARRANQALSNARQSVGNAAAGLWRSVSGAAGRVVGSVDNAVDDAVEALVEGACFVAGTLVSGITKAHAIEEIQVGDVVRSAAVPDEVQRMDVPWEEVALGQADGARSSPSPKPFVESSEQARLTTTRTERTEPRCGDGRSDGAPLGRSAWLGWQRFTGAPTNSASECDRTAMSPDGTVADQ